MERLLSGARRSANPTFPDDDVRLRSEFQVGIHQPADFASEIDRAGKVHAARLAHPTARAAKDQATLVARNRFLLDEFPPRDREKPEAIRQVRAMLHQQRLARLPDDEVAKLNGYMSFIRMVNPEQARKLLNEPDPSV